MVGGQFDMMQFLAQSGHFTAAASIFTDYAGWWVCLIAVVVGLVILGWRDVSYFSLKRVWAISSVNFSESIRRKVLWITPLAILGVIIVAQLQRPIDEQDALRQTIKFSIFATGLLVTIIILILASTNLPKEIETRVIFTVVTKPVTRLEIVLGKIIGFARVSAVILLIMGLFTWGYLHVRAWNMQRFIGIQLQEQDLSPVRRASLEHYEQAGLLQAKQLHDPSVLGVYAHLPEQGSDMRWVYSKDMSIAAEFSLMRDQVLVAGTNDTVRPVRIVGRIQVLEQELTPEEVQTLQDEDILAGIASTKDGPLALGPGTQPVNAQPPVRRPTPTAMASVLTLGLDPIVDGHDINNGIPVSLMPDSQGYFSITLTPNALGKMVGAGQFYVVMTGQTPGVLYGAGPMAMQLVIGPDEQGRTVTVNPKVSTDDVGGPAGMVFLARTGNYGQQLSGGTGDRHPVGVYSFTGASPEYAVDGQIPFELRMGIERGGADVSADDSDWTHLQITIHNRKSGVTSEPIDVFPEAGHTSYFSTSQASVAGGDFDVRIRNLTEGHWVGLQHNSVWLVTGSQPFAYNVFKSMLILWLMTILVISIAVFSSTFLSWPIAIVLTVVILLGHWGVVQLQDSLQRGVGAQVAKDFGFTNAGQAKVVSSTIDALAATLNTLAPALPDVSQYSATEDIERGVAVPPERLLAATKVTLWFGLPLTVVAYLFLRRKEVAP